MKKQHGASCTCDECMDKDERKWTVWHEPKLCEHCQQPMLYVWCDDCDGNGGWWSRVIYFDEHGDDHRWQECQWCAGTGHRWHCTNRDCPGVIWYPLSREDSATLRMVIASVEREEKR